MANTGHPMPILLNTEQGSAEWFMADRSSTGPALAISEGVEYSTVERQIRPGDAMVLFTDGIYEVAAANQEEFGEERLLAAAQQYNDLSLRDLFPALLNEARQFAAERAFDDDVCLVGFRLRELLTA